MNSSPVRASFWRRLAALIYDYLLAVAIFCLAHFVGFAVLVLINHFMPSLTAGYPDLASYISDQPLYSLYLCAAVLSFFLWFWLNGGQTLGMKAWHVKVQSQDGKRLLLKQALLKALFGLFGLGTLLALGTSRLGLQDRLSGTEVIYLSSQRRC
ncbi:RDD family protein [Gallaecimonas mangrovi]|uniref:RDD family protein n=1 Tax=Gallaecimonas mangrovi TaxID=2291597 RepID=UPI000E202CDF|nr:RDD family protein [Gallaecimonas mangrovi]